MDEHDDPPAQWEQAHIRVGGREAAEVTAATRLCPGMTDAEAAGLVGSWFYVRKGDWWRLRYLPANSAPAGAAKEFVGRLLHAMREQGQVPNWVENIYEPETHAFGGPEGMGVAHHLFHSDSRCFLDYLNRHGTKAAGGPAGDKRKELSVLLCSVLMRAAGQDLFEQGDVWARVSENRPAETTVPPEQARRLEASMRRLMTVDTSPGGVLVGGPLDYIADWMGAFDRAGSALGELSRGGVLTRGLRAVLAHHVIFHWNRLGIPYAVQAAMATAARNVVLGD